MDQLIGTARFPKPRLGFERVRFEFGELFPVEVVKEADDAPELLVFGIEFPREITQRPFERLSVLDVKRLFVVLLQKSVCLRKCKHRNLLKQQVKAYTSTCKLTI